MCVASPLEHHDQCPVHIDRFHPHPHEGGQHEVLEQHGHDLAADVGAVDQRGGVEKERDVECEEGHAQLDQDPARGRAAERPVGE